MSLENYEVRKMVKILYLGDISPCRVRVGNSYIKKWEKNEVKDLDRETAKNVLKNRNFSLVGGKKLDEKKVVSGVKGEEPVYKFNQGGENEK